MLNLLSLLNFYPCSEIHVEDQGDAEDKGDLGDVASLESGSGTNESTSSGIGISYKNFG